MPPAPGPPGAPGAPAGAAINEAGFLCTWINAAAGAAPGAPGAPGAPAGPGGGGMKIGLPESINFASLVAWSSHLSSGIGMEPGHWTWKCVAMSMPTVSLVRPSLARVTTRVFTILSRSSAHFSSKMGPTLAFISGLIPMYAFLGMPKGGFP